MPQRKKGSRLVVFTVLLFFMGIAVLAGYAQGQKETEYVAIRFVNETNNRVQFSFVPDCRAPVCEVGSVVTVPAYHSVNAGGLYVSRRLDHCLLQVGDEQGEDRVSFDPLPYLRKRARFDENHAVCFIRRKNRIDIQIPY